MDLENHILDNADNKNNLKDLITTFDKDLFIPFIGAGPSITLGEPKWGDLLARLCKSLKVKNVKRAKSDGSIDYPKTFSRLFDKVSDDKQVYKKLFELVEPTQTEATWFHKRLVEAFDSYITTNYDSPIEEAFTDVHTKRKLKKQYFSCYGLDNISNCIIYLHGHKDINFCIIKSEDYDYFYPSISNRSGIPILEDFLTEIFTLKSIIFVGFSFNDKYIEKFLHNLHQKTKFIHTHYCLLSQSSDYYQSIERRLEELKSERKFEEADAELSKFYSGQLSIKPIVYKHDHHIFADRLFKTLKEIKREEITTGDISGTPVR